MLNFTTRKTSVNSSERFYKNIEGCGRRGRESPASSMNCNTESLLSLNLKQPLLFFTNCDNPIQ